MFGDRCGREGGFGFGIVLVLFILLILIVPAFGGPRAMPVCGPAPMVY